MELLNTDGLVAEAGMADQGCHFNFFLEGQIFFIFFNATGTIEKLEKTALYMYSNLTLFLVPFFLFFFFLFPWEGDSS